MCDMCVVCLCLCGTVGANWTKPNSRAQRVDRFSWSFPAAALRTGGFDNPWGLKQRHARRGKCVSKEVGELKKKNLEHRFRDFQGCPRFHMPQMWVSSSRTCYRFPHRCWYQPFVHSLMLCWRWIKSSALSRFFCGTNVSRRIQLCQLRKATVLLHEFQGWPHLCQLPGVQDTDTVATHDGGDPMRDA